MARGWESKSVEEQQAGNAARASGEASTREQRARRQKRESLELSRRRILRELEASQSPVRIASLEQALAFLDGEIAKLDSSG